MQEKNTDSKQFYPFDHSKSILDYPVPMDHTRMMQYITCFQERYSFLNVQNIGTSVLGKNIPVLCLGEGKKGVLYVGAQHGMDWITTILLLRFVNEYAEYYRTGRQVYGLYLPYLFYQRRIWIVPMLNPDGVDYVLHGVSAENPLYERLVKMNGGPDFSTWQANGRGVDLYCNCDIEFERYRSHASAMGITEGQSVGFCGEAPESEPEIAYLCQYVQYIQPQLHTAICLQTPGERVGISRHTAALPRSVALSKILTRLTSYTLFSADKDTLSCGFSDWISHKLQIPAFELHCGRGKPPLPQEQYFCVYAALREMLFQLPQLL